MLRKFGSKVHANQRHASIAMLQLACQRAVKAVLHALLVPTTELLPAGIHRHCGQNTLHHCDQGLI